ncbi:sigma factor-like helix-turn-helix DNA-binding protein [Salinicoccus siamensis]|uniref:Sigma factor-like helix-turn-helix DNA-binding protein n=1 Tax=Salinicoccus siamensis TaxID=381830 RepID=A0ABV5Z467_9STAP
MKYTTETYSTEKIMDMINSYPYYISKIKELRAQYNSDVGGGATAQYGIESVMPKAQGTTSDPVHNEVERRLKRGAELSRLEARARYIQNRWSRITDERMALVFNLRLDGMTYQSIAEEVGVSTTRVYQIMKEACLLMKD